MDMGDELRRKRAKWYQEKERIWERGDIDQPRNATRDSEGIEDASL